MMRLWRCLTALVLALLLTLSVGAAGTAGFSDVPESHWAAQSIRRCAQYNLLQGVGGGRFGLGRTMTRAAYATALCRLMGWELVTPEKGSFMDNQDTAKWYYSAIETAYAHGALTGESRQCRPNDAITREEMAKMTVRALGLAVLSGAAADDCPFSDVSVAQGYVALAYRMGIIKGVSAYNFEPKKEATREQAAAVLLRTYDRLHAAIKVTEAVDGSAPSGCVTAGSITEESGSVPVSPRAPMEAVYTAAVRAGEGGSVALRAVALLQVTRAGAVTDTRELTEGELIELLSEGTLRTHRSAQHESSCGYRTEKDGSVTVVWYESETDIAEKTELCRLLGIGNVYVLK